MTVEEVLTVISKGINKFDHHSLVACNRLNDALKDFTCRTTRALDRTDGKARINKLPPDHRASIMRTGYNDR